MIVEQITLDYFVQKMNIEYVDVIITEYIDCETGLPCTSGMEEILNKSTVDNRLFNLNGQIIREPKGVYIEGGKIKYKFK